MELNVQMYNRFFYYCETLGTTPLKEYQQNNHESCVVQNLSDNESQVSNIRQEKCPTNAIKKIPQARNRQFDSTKADGQNEHNGR